MIISCYICYDLSSYWTTSMRNRFKWEYPSWVSAAAFTGAGVMVSLNQFKLSYGLLFVSAILIQPSIYSSRLLLNTKILLASISIILAFCFSWCIYSYKEGKELQDRRDALASYEGDLQSAEIANPGSPCPANLVRNGYQILFGTNASFTSSLPHVVLMYKRLPLLTIKRGKDGGMAVNFKAFNKEGKIIAELTNNHFIENQNVIFHKSNPDLHTLVIFDQEDREILRVKYINKNFMKISGDFRLYNNVNIPISLNSPSMHISNSCFGESGLADILIE